jgi:hypothetical protein
MATKPCDTCSSYDPVLRGFNRGGHKETSWAWCAKKSVYPVNEEPGQKFPPGAKRMSEAVGPAKPFIIKRGQIVGNCTEYQERKSNVISKTDLLKKIRTQNGNKIAG